MDIFEYIDFSNEVKNAFQEGIPVVAIETAGTYEAYAYPQNKEMADLVTAKVRENGAVPAYIAMINGRIKVGLEEEDSIYLAKMEEPLLKASRRDIPLLITKKMDALTAVAATMMIADMVGVKVVTGGGIGGVHRGAETSFDISADLQEFNKSDVVVVCSGAKSILDLKLTMEYLETQSVTVVGYKTNELPAYMSIHSGCKLDFRLDSPEEIAESFRIKKAMGGKGGILVAQPIDERYAVPSDLMDAAVLKAVKKAEEENIQGKVITKFIMDIVKAELGGDSYESSVQMNVSNAALAARVSRVL